MKKIIIFFSAIIMAVSSFATDNVPTKNNVEVNSFWSNWFVGVGGGAQVGANQNGFVWNSVTPVTSLEVGKWITPVVGLRGLLNAGHYSTLAKPDYSVDKQLGGAMFADLMFNLTNINYKHNRAWNLIPYVGFGRVASETTYKNWGQWAWNFGLDNQFKLSKHVGLDVDLFANRHNGFGTPGRNWNTGATLGLVFNLGKTDWDHAVDAAALAALYQAQVDTYKDIADMAMSKLEECGKEKAKVDTVFVNETVTVSTPTELSVFFAGDSFVPESQKDLRNLCGFVEYAKEHKDAVINVVGYADSKTGSKKYNQELSEKRAEAVADYLIGQGVGEDQVNAFGLGGVDELNPYNYNRRVVVELK